MKTHYSCYLKTVNLDSADDCELELRNDKYAFTVHENRGKISQFTVNVYDKDDPVVIDIGATVSIIARKLWERLKRNKIKWASKISA